MTMFFAILICTLVALATIERKRRGEPLSVENATAVEKVINPFPIIGVTICVYQYAPSFSPTVDEFPLVPTRLQIPIPVCSILDARSKTRHYLDIASSQHGKSSHRGAPFSH